MLTESEKRWLIKRAKKWANFCDVCIVGNENCKLVYFRKKCPTNIQTKDLLEALEFESKVVAKLALVAALQKKHHCCVDIDIPFHCPGWQYCAERIMSRKELRPCEFEMLKGVRIEVEEEMECK